MWRRTLVVCLLAAAPLPAQQRDWDAVDAQFHEFLQQGDFLAAKGFITGTLADLNPDENLHATGSLLWYLGLLNHVLGDFDEANLRFRAAISALERAGPPAALTLAKARIDFASLLDLLGSLKEADRLRRSGLAVIQSELGPGHPLSLNAQTQLAEGLLRKGDLVGAEQLCRNVLFAAHASGQFPLSFLVYNDSILGSVLLAGQRHTEAAETLGNCLTRTESLYGPHSPAQLNCSIGLAIAHVHLRQFDRAAALLQDAEGIVLDHLGPQHPQLAEVLHVRCELLRAQGKTAEAKRLAKAVRNLVKAARERSHSVSWAEWTGAARR